jgi:hypothetical protein
MSEKKSGGQMSRKNKNVTLKEDILKRKIREIYCKKTTRKHRTQLERGNVQLNLYLQTSWNPYL